MNMKKKAQVNLCRGKKLLGSKEDDFTLNAAELTQDEFNALFENAEKVHMCVVVENTDFVNISFPRLTRWKNCASGPHLRIIGNDYLENIHFNKSLRFIHHSYVQFREVVTIRGNRKLTKKAIDRFAGIFKTYRFIKPAVGECALPGLVKDMSNLNCRAYYGDIAFGEHIVGEVPTRAGIVDGCLSIKKTTLTDIEFLRGFHFKPTHDCENEIVDNPHLCISEKLERHLRREINVTIKNNMPNSCRTETDLAVVFIMATGLLFIAFSAIAVFSKVWSLN